MRSSGLPDIIDNSAVPLNIDDSIFLVAARLNMLAPPFFTGYLELTAGKLKCGIVVC